MQMTIFNKNESAMPTTTALVSRLCIFQPTRRPTALYKSEIKTPWGYIKITGRLGQQHADVLESICFHAEKKAVVEDGRIKLLVDPAVIRRSANITSGEQFEKIIIELQTAVIDIIEPSELSCSGHVVDHIDKAQRSDGSYITKRNPLGGGERHLWRVELGKAFCKLIGGDIWRCYDPRPLALLELGVAQAVARHVKTHKTPPPGGWHIDSLIEAVLHDKSLSGDTLRNHRRSLRKCAEGLLKIGIIIKNDRVTLQ